jgi:Xaa-Pro aminopeptidase
MRLIKDTEEIELLRKAAQISSDGHRAAMRAVRYSKNEMQVEAALVAAFRSAGAHYAFEPIVASGKNACTLHYCANNAPVRQRHLVLVDAGAEYCGYAGDVTRTFPASGKFTEAQADVYDIVLAAQKKALTAIKPGNTWSAIENTATRTLAQGLIDLGLCKGTIKTVLKKSNYQRFYMHRIGHFLGLDVHDVGRHKNIAGKQEPLRAGMVVTVEPGLYIPDEPDIPAPLRGIGVRIEDDVLVTDNGKEVLSGAPKTRTDIEAWIHG